MKYTYKQLRKKFANGGKFTATIYGVECNGAISFEKGNVFFCTNKSKLDGSECDQRFGFKYSWVLDENVKDIKKVHGKYKPRKLSAIFGYPFKWRDDTLIIGCGAVEISKNELVNYFKTDSKYIKNILSVYNENVTKDYKKQLKKTLCPRLKLK